MLVLKVQKYQKVFLNGGAITLRVTDCDRGWAKIGIEAPKSVKVMREGLIAEEPTHCCHCGGTLPPPDVDGAPVTGRGSCAGEPDTESGRCRAFLASTLWGDIVIPPEREEGNA